MRMLFLAALAALSLSGCMDVREEVTVGTSGSAVWETHTDMSRGLAMLERMGSAAMPGMALPSKDMDYTSTLRILPDSFNTHVVLSPHDSILTLDTRAYISDMAGLQKMREHMMQQMEGVQYMMRMRDTGKRKPDLMRWMRVVQTSWTAHEIKRTVNQALLDSLKAEGTARKDTGAAGPMPGGPAAMAFAMMGGGHCELIFHLPSPVTHVEGNPYSVSADRKTVTFDRKFMDIFKDPKTLTFTIDY